MIGIIKLEVGRLACIRPMYNQNANDNDENDNLAGSWLVPMLRCHPEHVSLSPVTNIEAMQLVVQCIFSARSSVAVTIAQIETTSTIQCNVMVTPRSCKTLVWCNECIRGSWSCGRFKKNAQNCRVICYGVQ